MVVEQAWQQNRSIVFLHLGSLMNQQNVLVVGEVKLSAGLLILIPDVVKLSTGSTSCRRGKGETQKEINRSLFGLIESRDLHLM